MHAGDVMTLKAFVTAEGIGAGQGVEVRDGFVYLYGDADTGVIREFKVVDKPRLTLEPTGRLIRLTREGKDLVPHPTGLTWHEAYGTFIGDTVAGKGTIYHIDWQRALANGNLDHAVLNVCIDDAAVNGTRPEFVEVDNRWFIATSDYGNVDNAVRLYDPVRLSKASRTTERGVMVASYPCTPWVQNVHWLEDHGVLALVQNQIVGLRWRVTFVDGWSKQAFADARPVDFDLPDDELEGMSMIDGDMGVLMTSSSRTNTALFTLESRWRLRALRTASTD